MADKVKTATAAEAKALGFTAAQAKLITKENGQFVFSPALAPERGGFQSVGVAKPGQVQMTPYYGDVTGAYRLSQEQFASAYTPGGGTANTPGLAKIMQENEIKALVAGGMSIEEATAKVSGQYGDLGVPLVAGGAGGSGATGGAAGSGTLGTTPTSGMTSAKVDAIAAISALLSSYGIGDLSASIT